MVESRGRQTYDSRVVVVRLVTTKCVRPEYTQQRSGVTSETRALVVRVLKGQIAV
jgi:hypothetical protein